MVVNETGTQKKMANMTALKRYKAVKRCFDRNLVQSQPIVIVPIQDPNPRIETDQAKAHFKVKIYCNWLTETETLGSVTCLICLNQCHSLGDMQEDV
jgi:hypothetical protein